LRHLLPILSPSFVPPSTGEIMKKVLSDLDFYLPFRQHAPSLRNARHKIYAEVDQFPGDDGAGFFNILAFRGVFFGSPFAQSDRYRWFNTLQDWERFRAEGLKVAKDHGKNGEEETYYVKRNCYGQSQTLRSTTLLSKYWDKRNLWSAKFDKSAKPSITEVYKWLIGRSSFPNIGTLSALLICGDLIEADILPMPDVHEWGGLIWSLNMGAKTAMEILGLISHQANKEEVAEAFLSLDSALQHELKEEEKEAMNYNVIMLEHTLCKIKRLTTRGITMETLLQEI
jgi:hypothetical protein